jgi:hypothetical protein
LRAIGVSSKMKIFIIGRLESKYKSRAATWRVAAECAFGAPVGVR